MFNPAAERLFGYHAVEALGRNIQMLMPAPYIDEYNRYLQNYRVTGERKIIGTGREVVGRRRDGTTFPMHLFVGEAKEGEDTIFVGVVHDLTRSRAADAALRETQMLLSRIVSSSDDAMISKTLDGTVTTWNQGAARIFGYSAEEIVGKPISVLAAPGREDDMTKVLEQIKRGARVEHYETQRRRKDGAIVDISLTVSPIHDAEGRTIGASKIARDITAQKAADNALRLSETKYRTTFDMAPVGIIHVSSDRRYLMVNDFYCNLLGYTRGELLAKEV